jgi:hypothetical protein
MDFDELSPELRDKVKSCKSPQEILDLAKAEGYELIDAELEGISGGSWCTDYVCEDHYDWPHHNG